MLLTLLNSVMLGWFVVGPQSSQFVQRQWQQWNDARAAKARERQMLAWQQQCLTNTFPPDRVVYQERPAEARKLVSDRAAYAPVSDGMRSTTLKMPDWSPPALLGPGPAPWTSFKTAMDIRQSMSSPAVYLGERTVAGSSTNRLVEVHFDAQQLFNSSRSSEWDHEDSSTARVLFASAIDPAQPGKPATLMHTFNLQLVLPEVQAKRKGGTSEPWQIEQHPFTLFSGQSDPNDASHFTIPYRLDGSDGVIDGWLSDEGVLLKPREGRSVIVNGGRGWEIVPSTRAVREPPAGAGF